MEIRHPYARTPFIVLKHIFVIASSLLPAVLPAATQHVRQARGTAAEAITLADEYLASYRARYPESDGSNQAALFDNSIRAYQEWNRREARFLDQLRQIEPRVLRDSPEAITLALLRERLEMSRAFQVCRRELWNVGPLTSWLSEYRAYAARQPVGNATARATALRRWSQLPSFIDTEIGNLRAGVRAGYSAPRLLVSAAVAQTNQVLAVPPVESPFFSPAARDSSLTFRASFEALVRDSINPALRRYRDYLADEYAPQARLSVGVADLPNGTACFGALVRRYTTLDIAPRDLKAKGTALLADLDAQSIRDRQRQMIADSAFQFRSSTEALGAMTDALRRAAAALPKWFNRLPAVLVPEVDSMPDAGASDPDAAYVPGSGREPPRVYVNIPRLMEGGGRLYAERLAFHEGIPGHHLQIALQRSADAHPLNRLLWNAGFGEGWAVYASNLADEMGLYSSEATRFAAVKSKVDDGLTFLIQHGLHVDGWTWQQAIDTLLKYSGAGSEEASQQVDYFIAAPAHALAYPLGVRYIEDLKHDASSRLGAKFDVRRFHDVILENGALPLSILRESVDRWVASQLR